MSDTKVTKFPHTPGFETEPCPVRPGGGLFEHGERTSDGRMYCACHDIFCDCRPQSYHDCRKYGMRR